jgi:hypothetical protein
MTDETKHENAARHGGYERQDLQVSGILYFLLGLGVATLLCILGLKGIFAFLEHREKALQPAVNPLITNVPADTRHIPKDYEERAFPDPLLEKDEHTKIDELRSKEEKMLYSYGWVDEKAGTVHIPIERAMDLLAQRGLPIRGQSANAGTAAARTEAGKKESSKAGADKKGIKK